MLRALRDGTKTGFLKYILLGILLAGGAGLILFDVQGFFRGGISQNDVAKVGSKTITTAEFDRALRRVLQGQGSAISVEDAYRMGFVDKLLNSQITDLLIYQYARSLGIHVGEETLVDQIERFTDDVILQEGSKKEQVQAMLRARGISEAEFLEAIDMETTNGLVVNGFSLTANYVPEELVNVLYDYDNEKRTVQALYFRNSAIKDLDTPEEDILRAYYESRKQNYLIPETRNFTLGVYDIKNIEDTIAISDEELKAIYEEDQNLFTLPERREIAQSVFENQELAQKVLEKLESGTSLERATKDISGDESNYFGQETFEQAGLIEDIAQPVFESKKGDILGPIETPLGWHVIVVKDIFESQMQSFETVKDQIKSNLLQNRLADSLFDMANQIDDRLAGGESLEDIASSLEMTLHTFAEVNAAGRKKDGKTAFTKFPEDQNILIENSFALLEDETSPVFELSNGNFAALRIDSIQQRSYQSFEAVKGDLEKLWVEEQRSIQNRIRTQAMLSNLREGQKTLADLARENGIRVQNYNLQRNQDAREPLSASSLSIIFNGEKDVPLIVALDDGFMIARTISVSFPEKRDEEGVQTLRTQLENIFRDEMYAVLVEHLRQKYKPRVNESVLEAMYANRR